MCRGGVGGFGTNAGFTGSKGVRHPTLGRGVSMGKSRKSKGMVHLGEKV